MGRNCTRLHESPDALFDAMSHLGRSKSPAAGGKKKEEERGGGGRRGEGKGKPAPSGDKCKKGFVRYCHEFFREG